MKFILGKKLGMTQVFREDGSVVPVTRVQAGPCVVTQVKTNEKDGVDSIQFGYGTQKTFRLSRAEQGHLKGIEQGAKGLTVRHLRELSSEGNADLKRGDIFTVKIFDVGERVKVTGTAKGRGFQGVVKRHGFHGSPASHGHKDQLRMPGSIGATGPARVFKGTRMAGHMGANQVSVQNLEVIEIHPETNEMFIKGAIPGSRNGLILISTNDGSIEVDVAEAPAEEVAALQTEEKVEAEQVEQKEEPKAEVPAAEDTTDTVEEKTEEAKEEPKEEVKAEDAAPAEKETEQKEEPKADAETPAEETKEENA